MQQFYFYTILKEAFTQATVINCVKYKLYICTYITLVLYKVTDKYMVNEKKIHSF